MVKTRSDLKGVRVSTKAPRKMPPSCNSSSGAGNSGRSSKKYDGGNAYCPRETPPWQQEITKFFPSNPSTDIGASTSNGNTSNLDLPSESTTSDS